MTQLALALTLNEQMLFNNFIGKHNQEIIQTIGQLLPEKKPAFNTNADITYVYGESGMGKTHLLQACCHQIINNDCTVVYIDCAIDELNQETVQQMINHDWICLDNVHLASQQTQYALYSLYNQGQLTGLKLVVASCLMPKALNLSLVDLTTRLSRSTVFVLESLDYEQKQIILKQKMHSQGIVLSDDIYPYLIKNYSRNLKKLLLMLDKINKKAVLSHKRAKGKNGVNLTFVKTILG